MVRHHLMARLSRYCHTLWVNPALPWREAFKRKKQVSTDTSLVAYPGFGTYTPELWLPEFYRPQWLADFSFRQRLKRARRLLELRGCRKIVLYLWRPEFERTLRMIPVDMSCYHLEDEYSFSRVDKPIDPMEARLLGAVNQVFVLSPALFEKKGRINPHTMYLPGGVDFEAYSQHLPEPKDLAAIPRPRIGYVGSLKWQINWDLLLYLSKEHPEWSFVLVGPPSPHPEIAAALSELSSRNNVYFLGGKPTAEMIAYPQHFDVCVMPYGVNDYTKYIYPLKLHEYLASGRPLVGTPIASLEPLNNVVSLPGNAPQWSRAIAEALAPAANTLEQRQARQRFARQHDWEALVRRITETIAQHLGSPHTETLAQHFKVHTAEMRSVQEVTL
jgi:glycosyltransferase involved in cell wall biosynthesis